MTTIEQKINALAAFVLAEDSESRDSARKALNAMMKVSTDHEISLPSDTENTIHEFLTEIGAPPHVLGYRYVVYGIMEAIQYPEILDDITRGFYPRVAAAFNTTATRVERSIRHLIETTWVNGDIQTLHNYFGSTISNDRAKPVNSHFIARSAIIIRTKVRK
ncbi:MAG: sporulation initiation factor Spo0A C-terminal domain-containing protein [Oscillospiraceae bacterium]